MKTTFHDRQGVAVPLGKAIAQGGEGTIHEIDRHSKFVAKVYHKPPSKDKAEKLAAMVACKTERLMSLAAWPVEVLHKGKHQTPVGVVMPKVQGFKDIHLLYGPRSRLQEFPLAGWNFLVQAATNLARAFAAIHEHGHVIGDVNDKLAVVSDQAVVMLVDCDSFQIKSKKGRFTCDVGVLTHQPPEFQDVATFRGLERTTNHDNFGLAVLIFQLLFMARHPFSGTFKGTGDMSLERAIHEFRFVYGKDAEKNEMAPPPASLDLSTVTPEVAALFERAFSKKGAKKGRPEAKEWVKALEDLQKSIRKCRSNPCHAYLKGRNCPFCAIESQTGSALFNLPILFKTKAGKQKTVVINVGTIWKEIRAVDGPGPTPVFPTDEVGGDLELDLPPTETSFGVRMFQVLAGLAAASAAVYFIPRTDYLSLLLLLAVPLLWFGRLTGPSGKLEETREALEKLRRRWTKEASPREFLKMQVALKEAKKDLENLDEEHDRIIEKLSAKKREHQLEAFLDRHRVAEASIPGIGRAACVVLESHGIETARNVKEKPLKRVSGLGSVGVKALMNWRKDLEARFVFDPMKSVDPVAIAGAEREIQKRRAQLVQKLADGPAKLRYVAKQTLSRRKGLKADVEKVVKDYQANKGAS